MPLAIRTTIAALLAAAALPAGALAAASPGKGAHDPSPVATKQAKPTPAQPSAASGRQSVQGVVQSLTPAAIVVKQLDGTTVSVPYDKKTHFFIEGKRAEVGGVKSGYVLVASWNTGNAATTLRFLRPS